MEILERILGKIIAYDVIPLLQMDWEKLMELKCCSTIIKICEIVSDDTLEDPECFQKIEAIVNELQALGASTGGRHDF